MKINGLKNLLIYNCSENYFSFDGHITSEIIFSCVLQDKNRIKYIISFSCSCCVKLLFFNCLY